MLFHIVKVKKLTGARSLFQWRRSKDSGCQGFGFFQLRFKALKIQNLSKAVNSFIQIFNI